jgi:hypothetical protein
MILSTGLSTGFPSYPQVLWITYAGTLQSKDCQVDQVLIGYHPAARLGQEVHAFLNQAAGVRSEHAMRFETSILQKML